jgi:hypothetical protein
MRPRENLAWGVRAVAVEMKTGVSPTSTYQFNESRLEKVVTAKSLDEATRMGFLDSIVDWFKGGVKKEAITELYNSITSPGLHDRGPSEMIDRFHRLRDMAVDDRQSQFTVGHGIDEKGQWQFTFKVGDTAIYRSERMQDSPNHSYDQFRTDHEFRQAILKAQSTLLQGEDTFSLESYIEANIQCMSDDRGVQENLKNSLDDPRFSRENFLGIEPARKEDGELDSSRFVALFRGEGKDDPPLKLVFSDRLSTNNELRGGRLKDLLDKGVYGSLRDIVGHGHLTRSDVMLQYAGNPPLLELTSNLGLDSRRELVEHLNGLPQKDTILEHLRSMTIGNTNFLELWFGNTLDGPKPEDPGVNSRLLA